MRPDSEQLPVVFIVSLSSDIGTELALHYLRKGATVCGTYRTQLPDSLKDQSALHSFHCDISRDDCSQQIASFFEERALRWDIFISCVGQLAPVGLFFETDFPQWERAVQINSTAQLRALHAVYPFRHVGQICHTIFFAGGGTNNPFRAYSAYCLGKIALIKMCELIDDEAADLNAFIVGTGWVRTKIHQQTLAAGMRAGSNHTTTATFLDEAKQGTSFADIAAMIDWGIAQGRPIAGGRNFSIVHDDWRNGGEDLAQSLAANRHKFKLRRDGNG